MTPQREFIDKEDEHLLSKYKFRIRKDRKTSYLITSINTGPKGKRKQVTQGIHRLILGLKPGDGKMVDHINGNGLDNRRSNLRLCTHSQNGANRKNNSNKTSKFKGVHWYKKNQRWKAQCRVKGKLIHLGSFKNELAAAKAYNKYMETVHGKFSRQNKV